jgi:hypothetical protein
MAAKNEYGLTPQQEAFALAVGAGKSLADAHREAYPKSAKWKPPAVHVAASELMAHPKVQVRVAQIQAAAAERAELDGAEIMREIGRLAMSDIAGIVKIDADGKARVCMPHELDPATRAAIASFEIDEFGRIKYKFWDKNAALEKAAKIKGLYKEDNEQKVNPLAAVISELSGNVLGVSQNPDDGDDDDD